MNRNTATGFLGIVMGLVPATSVPAACPPLPPPAELAARQQAENGARDRFGYAVLRLLRCDRDDAVPAFDAARRGDRRRACDAAVRGAVSGCLAD